MPSGYRPRMGRAGVGSWSKSDTAHRPRLPGQGSMVYPQGSSGIAEASSLPPPQGRSPTLLSNVGWEWKGGVCTLSMLK